MEKSFLGRKKFIPWRLWKKEKKLRNEEEFDQPVFFFVSSIRFPERKIKHMGWEYLFTTV